MQRREFVRLCAATGAAAAIPEFAVGAAAPAFYARVKLVDARGAPLRAKAIPPQTNLIFHYPYAATPCFLLNLGKPARASALLKTADKRDYEWKGGVGAQHSIVAYSAICAHQLAYPTRDISFISYRAESSPRNRHAQVIHCCAEHSQYDPAAGGKVLAGPAPQPLAAILLEHDARTDELYAVGTLGGEMFREFFAKYEFRLSLEHGGAVRQTVQGSAVVDELQNYCRQQVKC
ncbi:MAG: (2Fe-2S)-binding protein [Betaproteobacteria bacterium]|nr:(2Fe-2S)-binding protein [Betaproteobacteria bacterium]